MGLPGNSPVIVIVYTKIEQNIQHESKTEQREVQSIFFASNPVLYGPIDTKNIKRLNQQVQKKQKCQVCYELPFQIFRLLFYFTNVKESGFLV